MDLKLSGKKVLVTGSTAGIGLSIAEKFAHEGASVIINGRTESRIAEAINGIRNKYRHADLLGIAADLSTSEGAAKMIEEVPILDILVNNIGIYENRPFEQISDDDWIHYFQINVMSGIRMSRYYLPKMIESNWGRIIFIASEAAVIIPTDMMHYAMTKSAQLSIARGLAELTKGTGVTVNTVMPGPTRSEGIKDYIEDFAKTNNVDSDKAGTEFIKQTKPSSLIQRFIEPEEIADIVAFVASPVASAINGAPVRAEGGLIRTIA